MFFLIFWKKTKLRRMKDSIEKSVKEGARDTNRENFIFPNHELNKVKFSLTRQDINDQNNSLFCWYFFYLFYLFICLREKELKEQKKYNNYRNHSFLFLSFSISFRLDRQRKKRTYSILHKDVYYNHEYQIHYKRWCFSFFAFNAKK